MGQLLPVVALMAVSMVASAADGFAIDAKTFGVVGDGQADDTAALQKALDACGEQGGGIVQLGRGTYAIRGHLTIPAHVALEGVFRAPQSGSEGKGTTLLAYEGRGSEEGPAFITLSTNSTLRGVTIHYPEQTGKPVEPYPWCIGTNGADNATVRDCLLVNPYNGIDFGSRPSGRHFVSGVYGCPLRRGLFVDQCYDVGRVENVHFWPFWSAMTDPEIQKFVQENGEAFIFARTDWQALTNTFCWGYKVGYKFVRSEYGACNGSFTGIGADACNISMLVEDCWTYGLLITNGMFVAFPGPEPREVVVGPKNKGQIQFNNCAYWGPSHQIARIEGSGHVSFNQCNFVEWDTSDRGMAAIDVLEGLATVNACRFKAAKKAVHVAAGSTTVITANLFAGRDAVAMDEGTECCTVASNVTVATRPETPRGSEVVEAKGDGASREGEWEKLFHKSTFGGLAYTAAAGDGSAKFRWSLRPEAPGTFTVSVWVPEGAFAGDARYVVHHAGGDTEVTVDQGKTGQSWAPLGRFELDKDSYVELSNRASGTVAADAVAVTKAAR